jgi:hypothetical protein
VCKYGAGFSLSIVLSMLFLVTSNSFVSWFVCSARCFCASYMPIPDEWGAAMGIPGWGLL